MKLRAYILFLLILGACQLLTGCIWARRCPEKHVESVPNIDMKEEIFVLVLHFLGLLPKNTGLGVDWAEGKIQW
jgi:hypothetical protein